MDDLWGPPYYPATEDTMSFSLPYDVIEENDLNEKCCIQVLEILLTKANTDIAEHEEELMELLSQLACVDQVFSDMVSKSLKSKIDFLESSIKKLKDDAEDFFSTNREPAESIDDILKSLFCLYIQNKDLQFADVTRTGSSSDNLKKQIGSSSNANQMEKVKTVNISPVEKQTVSPTIVKVKEENTDYDDTNPAPKYPPLNLCWGSTKKIDREVSKFQMKSKSPIMVMKEKGTLQCKTPRCNSIGLKPNLETQKSMKNQPNIIKYQTDDENIGLAVVPFVESSEEPNSNSNVNVNVNEKQIVVRSPEPNFPPGYSKPQDLNNQSDSPYPRPYLTRTHIKKERLTSPLQTSSSSPHCALVVANPLDTTERCSGTYIEEDYYTVSELRAIARQRNVKGYFKLRKAELAQILGIKVIEGRRKQQKKRETQVVPVI